MNQKDWTDYFKAVNGRNPEPAEFAQALRAGEFVIEKKDDEASPAQEPTGASVAPAQAASVPATPASQVAQAPLNQATPVTPVAGQGQNKLTAFIKNMTKKQKIIALMVVALVLVCGGVYYNYKSGDITGMWEVESSVSGSSETTYPMVEDSYSSYVDTTKDYAEFSSQQFTMTEFNTRQYDDGDPTDYDKRSNTYYLSMNPWEKRLEVKVGEAQYLKGNSLYSYDTDKKYPPKYVKKGNKLTLTTFDSSGNVNVTLVMHKLSSSQAREAKALIQKARND